MSQRKNTWSLIIPTLNEEKTISWLLHDLVTQTTPPTEILVVDGQSQDFTREVVQKWVKEYQYISLISGSYPVGAQRDLGGKKATSKLLCFLDADVRLPADFLEKASQKMQQKNLHTACPRYMPVQSQFAPEIRISSFSIRLVYAFFNVIFMFGQEKYPSGAGSCILTTKKTFAKVGGFRSDIVCDDMAYIRAAAAVTALAPTLPTINSSSTFGMLPLTILVSDRRWKKYGFFPTLFTYIHLSVQFMKNNFVSPTECVYEFGKYEEKSQVKAKK